MNPDPGIHQVPPQRSPIVEERLRATARIRLRILRVLFLVAFAAVLGRLVQVQIIEVDRYKAPRRQYENRQELPASRGTLYDRNVSRIASNSLFTSFGVDPKLAADSIKPIAATFAKVFKKPGTFYRKKFKTDKRYVWLERHEDISVLRKIDVKKYPGLVQIFEPRRLYNQGSVAGQLLGTTNIDNKGIAGIELQFDTVLTGKSGYIVLQRDGLGRSRAVVDYPRQDPQDGHNVVLTLDLTVQSIVEEELKKGVAEHDADGGIAIVLQPATGDILAMAQYPFVNPADFGASPLQDQKLRAITDMFEPGSVFKIVTASAAIENGLVSPERKFNAEHGKYFVPGRPHPITDVHEYDILSFREAMTHSSNIVMAKISDIIGKARMFKMARDYGFGIPTNITLPGEVSGRLKSVNEWSGTTLNTIAYGYEVGVTPLQIALAYAAVANHGVLMRPRIFMREESPVSGIVRSEESQEVRRVVSPPTAATLVSMFKDVVMYGTGKAAAIPGITVAGKTGTSRKVIDGSYQRNYAASFVGFYPADEPRILCLVMLDIPREKNYTGGTTSAAVFRAINERIIMTTEYAPVPRSGIAEERPAVAGTKAQVRSGTQARRSGVETPVATIPAAGNSGDVVPDLTGLSLRQAMNRLTTLKLSPLVRGSGSVIAQIPVAGTPAARGMKVTLVCEPKNRTTVHTALDVAAQRPRAAGITQ